MTAQRRVPPNIKKAIAIIRACRPDVRDAILGNLAVEDPMLARILQATVLAFEDVVRLGRRNFDLFVREIKRELPVALKGADEKIVARILSGLSRTAGEELLEDIRFAGAVKRSEVDAARAKIVKLMREWIANRKIAIVPEGRADEWVE